jgi:hypothetical protein
MQNELASKLSELGYTVIQDYPTGPVPFWSSLRFIDTYYDRDWMPTSMGQQQPDNLTAIEIDFLLQTTGIRKMLEEMAPVAGIIRTVRVFIRKLGEQERLWIFVSWS